MMAGQCASVACGGAGRGEMRQGQRRGERSRSATLGNYDAKRPLAYGSGHSSSRLQRVQGVPGNLVETNVQGTLPCWPFPISRMGSSVLQKDVGTMRSDMQLLILIDSPARVSGQCIAIGAVVASTRACALAPLPTSLATTPSSTARRYLAVPKRRVQLQRGGSHIAC